MRRVSDFRIQVRGRQFSRRRLLRGAASAGAGLTAAALLSCGGRTSSSTSKPAGAATGTPRQGGTLALRLPDDIASFDGSTAAKNEAAEVSIACDRLLRFKSGGNVAYSNLTLEGELADRWELPDSQTYSFHLRPGTTFANLRPVNGRALTAADVKFSYEYATRSGDVKAKSAGKTLLPAQFNWMLEGLDGIEIPDTSTVVVKFKQPFAPFLNYVTSCALPVLPHEIYDQDGNFNQRIVGTGPFQFDAASSQHGTRSVWKKNPSYWEKRKPYLDQVAMLIIPDDSTAYAAFQSKQLDWLSGATMSNTDVQQVKHNNPQAVPYPYLFYGATDIWMNQTQGKLLADQRLRQAISLGIDRDEMIATLAGGNGAWALSGAFPDTFSQDEVKRMFHHDPAQARQLVSAAGYPNGVDVEFQYTTAYGPAYVSLIQLLQAQLKKAGINIVFKVLDRQDVIQRRKKGDYIMSATSNGDLETDIDSNVYQKFLPGSTGNNSRVDDPKLTDLIQAQRRELDAAKRRELIRQAIAYIAQQSEGLATFYSQHVEFWQPSLKNYAPNFGNPGQENAPNVTGSWQAR